ncbi:unnamed protein product [Thelazia callipaeda]|uniref:EGF-like domain-containing protein n=1 Tax=Thelazia callipaeda TaxID=103827 RepID=A0A158RBY7_THECL|nr:unnamed protein product [Thelazia callipaeda]
MNLTCHEHMSSKHDKTSMLKLVFYLLFAYNVIAHIALTFPPARFPPLDFLDTSRTMAPCGVPKPDSPLHTDLYVGESYNFTWRLQYPHQGGYRISMINETGDIVEYLAPVQGGEYIGIEDQISQNAVIRPLHSCFHCTVLLERQALEWGKTYGFRSCADVNVHPKVLENNERCSKHGEYENGKCKCQHSYSDDCSSDDDCLNGGKCVREPHAVITRTCYCAFGYFGQNCDRTYDGKSQNDRCFNYNYPKNEKDHDGYGLFQRECYKKTMLNADDFIYSRVVRYSSNTELYTELKMEKLNNNTLHTSDELEVILDYKSTSWISIGWRPMEIDRSCRLFPDLESSRQKRSTTEQVANLFTNRSEGHSVVQEHVPEIDPNMPPAPLPKLPKNNGLQDSALLAPLHPMDCTDVVIGSVHDGRLRINDMYTRDRSTPLYDIWLDGEESFSAAYGIERDGRTTIMFRRRIAEIEPSDHPLGPGKIFVIYAKGQTSGNYSHSIKTALENGSVGDYEFYKDDQVKYHGSQNRGVHPIEFVSNKERFPSIRPLPRYRQGDSAVKNLSSTEMHHSTMKQTAVTQTLESVPLFATTESKISISSSSELHTVTELHSVIGTQLILGNKISTFSDFQLESDLKPKPEIQSEPKLESKPKFQELDYLYFDNGSLSQKFFFSRSQLAVVLPLTLFTFLSVNL